MDDVPVGNAGIEHCLRPAMHRDGACSRLLQHDGEPDRIDAPLVPALSHLDCNGNRHGFFDRFDDSCRFFRVLHQGASVSVSGDFRHGTAHVDIDEVRAGVFQRQRRTLRHHRRVVSKNLRAADTRIGLPEKRQALFVMVDQRARGDHLRYGDVRAERGCNAAVRPVGHARHRGQHNGIFDTKCSELHARAFFPVWCRVVYHTTNRQKTQQSRDHPYGISAPNAWGRPLLRNFQNQFVGRTGTSAPTRLLKTSRLA